jgi:hypothetical protein
MGRYQSDEFLAKEAETQAFRDSIAAQAPGLDTDLTKWWNVFDGECSAPATWPASRQGCCCLVPCTAGPQMLVRCLESV